ncbi:MAG: hypothetical protein ACRYG8_27175 [Janthinobacterium lividum]
MSYQTTNPHAVNHPLRSIALIRPLSVLGGTFLAKQDPAAVARTIAARTVELARFQLETAIVAYADSKTALGEINRAGRKDRHDRDITPDRVIARRKSQIFGTMNRRRGALLQARRALFTAETALRALGH